MNPDQASVIYAAIGCVRFPNHSKQIADESYMLYEKLSALVSKGKIPNRDVDNEFRLVDRGTDFEWNL